MGVELTVEALNRWLNEPEVLRALPTFKKTLELPLPVISSPLALSVSVSAERLELRVSKAKPATFEVHAYYAITFGAGEHLALILPGGTLGLPAALTFEAGVVLVSRPDGGVAVTLDLTEPAVSAFDLALELVPESVREPIGELLRPLATGIAHLTLSGVHLFDVEPIDLGAGRIRLGLGGFQTDAASSTIFLGLRPNLAIAGAQPVRPDFARPLRGDARVSLDGRLPEAAVRALLHDGSLPRRFDADLRPDPEGPRAFTLDSLALDQQGLVASFTLWNLCFPSFAAQIRARASISQNANGTFLARLEPLELVHADHYEGAIRAKLGEVSSVAESLAQISERLLNEHLLGLPAPFQLSFQPVSYALGSGRIETEGRLNVVRNPPATHAPR